MENISHHAVFHYLSIHGLTSKEFQEDMVVTLGDDALSYSMVKKWAAEFKHGRESLEDNTCLGRPVTITTQETIAKIHGIIMAEYQSSTSPPSWVSPRNASIQLSTMNFICPRCQHIGSQSSSDLIWNGLGSTCQGKILRWIPTVFFINLWLWIRPESITSSSNQRWSNNRSCGNT